MDSPEVQRKVKIAVTVTEIVAVLLLIAGFFVWQKSFKADVSRAPASEGVGSPLPLSADVSAAPSPSTAPVPEPNPFDAANPFNNVYQNPFE